MHYIPKSVVRVYARLVSVSSRLTASLSNVTSEAVSRPDGSNVTSEATSRPKGSNVTSEAVSRPDGSNVTSEAVSRPKGSNVIFESRRNLLAMPIPSNVMEHNKYKSIIKPVLDERMVNLSNFTFLTLLEPYTFNPN